MEDRLEEENELIKDKKSIDRKMKFINKREIERNRKIMGIPPEEEKKKIPKKSKDWPGGETSIQLYESV